MMELKFKIDTAEMFSPPSVTAVMLQIPPDTTIVFANFEGRGNSKYFDCCTCEFDSIAINLIDSSKVITKSISSESNWETFNPNKSLGNKEIECRFKITSSDIQ